MVPKIRKVRSFLENFTAGPTSVCFRAVQLQLWAFPVSSLCLCSGSCILQTPSPVMHSSEQCSGGSLSLKMSLWPGLMTESKDLLLGTYLSSGEKQTEAFKPTCGHLLPLTLHGLHILTSTALLVNDNYKCPRGIALRQATSANWAKLLNGDRLFSFSL